MARPDDPLQRFIDATEIIEEAESLIDPSKPLYLLSWIPDPKLLPNLCFEQQHFSLLPVIGSLAKVCDQACFVLEATQRGNPHYHGWYQPSTDPMQYQYQIATIKNMDDTGQLKIDRAKHYRIFSFSEKNNSLYYYKKDVDLHSMYNTSVITRDSKFPSVDYETARIRSLTRLNRTSTSYRNASDWVKVLNIKEGVLEYL